MAEGQIGRVAFLGDVHMNTLWTMRAIDQAHRDGADVIMQVGDFGYSFDHDFLEQVSEQLLEAGLDLWFVDGNHEDHRRLRTAHQGNDQLREIAPNIHHAGRGYRWTWAGITFLALGGAHSVDRPWRTRHGFLWHREETLTSGQVQDAIAGGHCDVMISHDCPAGVDIPGLRPDMFDGFEIKLAETHRSLVRTVVDQVHPRRIIHGHYHVGYEQVVDFGYGPVTVTGLAGDGEDMRQAMRVIDLSDLLPAAH